MAREADLVFVGGRVFTAARVRAWGEGMAIRNDRFVAVGPESQVEQWTGRQTRRIDLHGRVVVPGFIDAHAHMADSAGESGWTRLSGTRSMEDALARLRKDATNTPAGEWVVGIDWDEAKWTDRRYPTRVDLDRVSTDHPVVARRIDCHMGSVNSLALERARDLVGLRGFDVDGSGRPTGILKEDAFSELHDRFASGPAVIERNLPRIGRMAHRLGITSIHDVVPMPAWQAYQRAHRRGASDSESTPWSRARQRLLSLKPQSSPDLETSGFASEPSRSSPTDPSERSRPRSMPLTKAGRKNAACSSIPPPSFGRPWRRPIGRRSRPRPTRSGMRPCASSRRLWPRWLKKIRERRCVTGSSTTSYPTKTSSGRPNKRASSPVANRTSSDNGAARATSTRTDSDRFGWPATIRIVASHASASRSVSGPMECHTALSTEFIGR